MKTFITISTAVLCWTASLAQTNSQIGDIDKTRQEIKDNIATFRKVERVKNDSIGYRFVYFKDTELKLITILAKDGDIDKNVEWYFSKGQLIYTQQIWTNRTTGQILDNENFYLSNGQLIAWINADKTVDNTSQEFKDTNTQLIAYIDKVKQEEK